MFSFLQTNKKIVTFPPSPNLLIILSFGMIASTTSSEDMLPCMPRALQSWEKALTSFWKARNQTSEPLDTYDLSERISGDYFMIFWIIYSDIPG